MSTKQDHVSDWSATRMRKHETHDCVSKEVKKLRWKMIGQKLRQDQNSDYNITMMTWAPPRGGKSKWHTVEKEKKKESMVVIMGTIATNPEKWK